VRWWPIQGIAVAIGQVGRGRRVILVIE